ncbi:hypothetical protein BU15DRAFT_68298 [Melanogaster broomeanus]|nr:hypothetical protein BU15DRAFT_68298 [Melanogaster broomeanus]
MSSASKSITPAPSMPSMDWARLKTPELDLDIEDNNETVMAKAKEHHQHKVETKHHEDEECHLWEGVEKHCQEEEEQHHWEEVERQEQRERKEVQRKAAEANKKRQREEIEAGPSVAHVPGMCCLCYTWAGVLCKFTNDGNKRQTTCDCCVAQREKCKWPEMHVPRARKGKGKAKEVPMSPCQNYNQVEVVGEKKSSASLSQLSLDSWFHDQGDEQPDGGVGTGTQGVNTGRLEKALEAFVDEAAICGTPEESTDELTEEEANKGEIEEELAGLQEDEVENPMSPKVGYKNVRW